MTNLQQSHRTFLGIFPPEEIQTELANIQAELKKEPSHVRWEPLEKFHITMKFLGDLNPQQFDNLCRHLPDAVKNFSSFEITLTHAGCFPSKKSPRIFWIGSEHNANAALVECYRTIESACVALGFAKDEHQFHPHITIGRAKGNVPLNLIKTLESITFEQLKFHCAKIAVMKSTLTQRGSFYSTIVNIPLK